MHIHLIHLWWNPIETHLNETRANDVVLCLSESFCFIQESDIRSKSMFEWGCYGEDNDYYNKKQQQIQTAKFSLLLWMCVCLFNNKAARFKLTKKNRSFMWIQQYTPITTSKMIGFSVSSSLMIYLHSDYANNTTHTDRHTRHRDPNCFPLSFV